MDNAMLINSELKELDIGISHQQRSIDKLMRQLRSMQKKNTAFIDKSGKQLKQQRRNQGSTIANNISLNVKQNAKKTTSERLSEFELWGEDTER